MDAALVLPIRCGECTRLVPSAAGRLLRRMVLVPSMTEIDLTESEWRRVFVIRCKSKRGEHVSDEERSLFMRAYKADPKRYAAMDADVFDATVPTGSTARARG